MGESMSKTTALPGRHLQVVVSENFNAVPPEEAPFACAVSQVSLGIDKTSSSIQTKLLTGSKTGMVAIWPKLSDAISHTTANSVPVDESDVFTVLEPISSMNMEVTKKSMSDARAILSIYGKCEKPVKEVQQMVEEGMTKEQHEQIARTFGAVPGLIVKIFRISVEKNIAGGLYLFDDPEKCEQYLLSDVWKNGSESSGWATGTCEISKFVVV